MLRRNLILSFIICLAFSFMSFARESKSTVDSLAWMKGCWASEDGKVTEQWMAPAGRAMLGMGRTVMNGEMVAFEFMQIRDIKDKGVHFIAKPSGQAEASFKLVRSSDKEVVFENPEHDFPQRVIYRLKSDGSLVGRIEGKQNGKEKGIDFPLIRAKCE
jgi:hypothetical protein